MSRSSIDKSKLLDRASNVVDSIVSWNNPSFQGYNNDLSQGVVL